MKKKSCNLFALLLFFTMPHYCMAISLEDFKSALNDWIHDTSSEFLALRKTVKDDAHISVISIAQGLDSLAKNSELSFVKHIYKSLHAATLSEAPSMATVETITNKWYDELQRLKIDINKQDNFLSAKELARFRFSVEVKYALNQGRESISPLVDLLEKYIIDKKVSAAESDVILFFASFQEWMETLQKALLTLQQSEIQAKIVSMALLQQNNKQSEIDDLLWKETIDFLIEKIVNSTKNAQTVESLMTLGLNAIQEMRIDDSFVQKLYLIYFRMNTGERYIHATNSQKYADYIKQLITKSIQP